MGEADFDDPLIGRSVGGRFTPLSRLGHGGAGVVHLAEPEGLGREVVVKVMRRDVALEPAATKRFEREARLVSGLHHPHIVSVHDFGRDDDGLYWFVMERLHGETLKDRLRRGPLSPETTRAVARQLALALAAAHARGVVHRDIKPANIWLLDAPSAAPCTSAPTRRARCSAPRGTSRLSGCSTKTRPPPLIASRWA